MKVILHQSEVMDAIVQYLSKRGIKAGRIAFVIERDGVAGPMLKTEVDVAEIFVHKEGPYR